MPPASSSLIAEAVERIRRALACGRPNCPCQRDGGNIHCPGPSHRNGDRNPSLNVAPGVKGVVIRCYTGCESRSIIEIFKERGLWGSPSKPTDLSNGVVPHADMPAAKAPPTKREIVAEYDYQRADGSLAFRVCREEWWEGSEKKKDFWQQRKREDGTWERKTDPEAFRTLLYRLPELLAAPPSAIVWLCAGEKDVDRLRSLGLVATTGAGGEGPRKWKQAQAEWLADRSVVILEDNDAVGREHAQEKLDSLTGVATSVGILSLPGLPEKGDVSDWLDAGGTLEQLLELGARAMAGYAPSKRIPSEDGTVGFPTDVLPRSMQVLVENVAASMSVPPEFVALPLLVSLATAIGTAWVIELKPGYEEQCNLYAAIIGDPGTKKSGALKYGTRPLKRIQYEIHRDWEKRREQYKADVDFWKNELRSKRGPEPEAPPYSHVYTTDATTEALAVRLATSKGIALVLDELSGWIGSMNQYRAGGKGADRQIYLSLWNGGEIKIDRKGSPDPIVVNSPHFSIIGGIQPDMLGELVDKEGRSDGFIERFVLSYPDVDQDRWNRQEVDKNAVQAVNALIARAYALTPSAYPDGETTPRVAKFNAVADALWERFYNEIAEERQAPTTPAHLRGMLSKFHGQVARLCLILHCGYALEAGHEPGYVISEQTLASALDLGIYFRAHAELCLANVRRPPNKIESRILDYLDENGACSTRTLTRNLFSGDLKTDRIRQALERLEEDGRVIRRTERSTGRPAETWEKP